MVVRVCTIITWLMVLRMCTIITWLMVLIVCTIISLLGLFCIGLTYVHTPSVRRHGDGMFGVGCQALHIARTCVVRGVCTCASRCVVSCMLV